jgi:hypothetical protein
VGALSVSPSEPWNRANTKLGNRESWTQEGMNLNKVLFIDGIEDGKPLFKLSKKAEFGLFRANMLPSEIMELTESSLAKLVNSSATSTANLTPASFAGKPGFQFTFRYVTDNDVPIKGQATGAVHNGKLYMIIYQAAETHYFDKGLAEDTRLTGSAQIN